VGLPVWTLIGVVIAVGASLRPFFFTPWHHSVRVDVADRRVDAIGARVDALDNKIDVKFDFLSSRIDGLVTEVGHLNLTLGELVGKAHTHGRVA
jgi:hypothetical protein